VGPFPHFPVGPAVHKWGEIDFGPAARFDPDEELSAWADYALKGAQNEIVKRAPVRIFVMGENVWREEQEWPPRRARPVTYYLHSGGNANSSSGDGLLGAERPAGESHDQFVHDPRNPVPTAGGPLCCDLPAGPHDQSGVEARSDVLVYSTPVLRESLEVTGPVKAVLYVGSDAPDTDFAAKLADVYPDGKVYNLTEGILRMRYREGFENAAAPLEAGQVYRIEIDMVATSNLFRKGHRIRLEVASGNFPRFDRNLNTGEPIISAREIRVARNRVYHHRLRPSALLLPVIARSPERNP
jgi:putative CocE/NonD family hydrolase